MGRVTRPGVLLDRDGTLNVGPGPHRYVTSVEGFAWLPGVPQALAELSRAGYVLAVASNQRGVAQGLVTPVGLHGIERRMQNDLAPFGVRIAAFRYCPHELDDACGCRKPMPGLLLALARELDLDLAGSWMVGDAGGDIAAGRAAGCRTAFVGDEPGGEDADLRVASLPAFARAVVHAGAQEVSR